jgi:hypothetical protein
MTDQKGCVRTGCGLSQGRDWGTPRKDFLSTVSVPDEILNRYLLNKRFILHLHRTFRWRQLPVPRNFINSGFTDRHETYPRIFQFTKTNKWEWQLLPNRLQLQQTCWQNINQYWRFEGCRFKSLVNSSFLQLWIKMKAISASLLK